ncbi:MAG: response regulator [Bacteroidia bacterium]|nr:response regulator [Bacteroidia bacterium]
MKDRPLNLIIIDDDSAISKGLEGFLHSRFKQELAITLFNSGEAALKSVGNDTDIVILDYNLKHENGNEILKEIKRINASVEVIMLTSNEDVGIAIDAFRKGARDYVIKGNSKAWKRVADTVYAIIIYPVNILVKEFGVSKYLAIFVLVFLVLGIAVFFSLKINW